MEHFTEGKIVFSILDQAGIKTPSFSSDFFLYFDLSDSHCLLLFFAESNRFDLLKISSLPSNTSSAKEAGVFLEDLLQNRPLNERVISQAIEHTRGILEAYQSGIFFWDAH